MTLETLAHIGHYDDTTALLDGANRKMMHTTRRHTTVIGLFSWLMGKFWLTLRPQSAVAQHTLWKTHFSNGLEAYRRADYDEAKEEFEAAYEAAHQAVGQPDVVNF